MACVRKSKKTHTHAESLREEKKVNKGIVQQSTQHSNNTSEEKLLAEVNRQQTAFLFFSVSQA